MKRILTFSHSKKNKNQKHNLYLLDRQALRSSYQRYSSGITYSHILLVTVNGRALMESSLEVVNIQYATQARKDGAGGEGSFPKIQPVAPIACISDFGGKIRVVQLISLPRHCLCGMFSVDKGQTREMEAILIQL